MLGLRLRPAASGGQDAGHTGGTAERTFGPPTCFPLAIHMILKQYICYLIAYLLSGVYRMHLSLVGQSFAHPPVKEETVEWQVGHAEKSCVRDALRCDADMFS